MNVTEKIKESILILDEVENYSNKISELQQETDYKLSDLYHYVEHNKLSTNECYRIIKEIQKQRNRRRELANDSSLLNTFENNKGKLNNINTRTMLITEMNKTNNRLNQPYKNRIYTDEEFSIILGKKG